MKVFICADMEGATGIVHKDQLLPDGGPAYAAGCALLTADVAAACEGALAARATEILISEGHAHMRNIALEALPPQARLLRGPAAWPQKPHCQVAGLDPSYTVALFVGFHSRAGTPGGLLSHTWAGAIVHEITVNGAVVGETAINALLCGAHGIPVGLVAGADDLIAEATADLAPCGPVSFVSTKQPFGFNLAACWPPSRTGPALREAASAAVTRAATGQLRPLTVSGPVVATLDTHRREMADRMLLATPGLRRDGPRRVVAEAPTVTDALGTLWRAVTEAFHEPQGWLR